MFENLDNGFKWDKCPLKYENNTHIQFMKLLCKNCKQALLIFHVSYTLFAYILFKVLKYDSLVE